MTHERVLRKNDAKLGSFASKHHIHYSILHFQSSAKAYLLQSSLEMSAKILLAIYETVIDTTDRINTAPNLRQRVKFGTTKSKELESSNHISVRKVAVNKGSTTRSSKINTAEDGDNISLRGDFLRSRAVWVTRTERVRVSSKSILQSIALE